MVETIAMTNDATDIIARIMAEMEEVFRLIDRPRLRSGDRTAVAFTLDLPEAERARPEQS